MSAAQTANPAAFTRGAVLAMILVGVLSFSAYFVLTAYAPELRGGNDGRTHALSKSAVGFAGVLELMRERGAAVSVHRSVERVDYNDYEDEYEDDGLLVATPQVVYFFDDEEEESPLDTLLDSSSWTLVVLPKWRTMTDFEHPGWVRDNGLLAASDVAGVLPSWRGKFSVLRAEEEAGVHRLTPVDDSIGFGEPVETGSIRSFQTIASPNLVPVLKDEKGGIVLGVIEASSIYVLAEPDLLNTQGLKDPATAWAGVHLLESVAGPGVPIAFDVTLHGLERTRNLLKLAFEPPFLAATLCALAAAIAMGLHAAVRFGPARRGRRAFALGKRALVDNSAALVHMAGRDARMAPGYASLTLAAVMQAVGGRRTTSEAEQRRTADRLSEIGRLPKTYSELAQKAGAATDPASALAAARDLHALRMELTRERR